MSGLSNPLRLLRGVGKIDGDGWKDVTKRGEIVFVYADPLPAPYSPRQYERVGNIGFTATDAQYAFARASVADVVRLLPVITRDRHDRALYAFRRKPTTPSTEGQGA